MEPEARLRDRLRRWPKDRYPLMHAGLRHRLGMVLAAEGDPAAAVAELRQAAGLYGDLPVERGTVRNSMGSILRETGDKNGALQCFEQAQADLFSAGAATAAGSAAFNLGLVLAETGRDAEARAAFEDAKAAFDPRRYPAEAGAAHRELGTVMARQGQTAAAIESLTTAVTLSAAASDPGGLSAASNNLGLALLADVRPEEAAIAFAEAAAASPITIRPESFAMAKANLSLAYDTLGQPDRARLAAHQALAAPDPPAAVVAQVGELLDRLGAATDLHRVLDSEPSAAWLGILRDEVRRWAGMKQSELASQVGDWVAGTETRAGEATERLTALLEAVLELPAQDMDDVLAALAAMARTRPDQGTAFLGRAARAAARFHPPQMQRVEAALGIGARTP